MKKNKKCISFKKNKNDRMVFTDSFTDFEISSLLCELLDFESQIESKKMSGQELNDKEYFFDTYMLKPSILIKSILRK